MHQQQMRDQLLQQHQQQRRRQSLLTKSVQEEFLIHQVKLRPALYDKSLKAYRKPGATDNAWAEIANALGVKVENCKKRWKSLRDTFIKYFRQEILADTIPGLKRKKWVYYEHMSFLRSHVELYGISETDSASDKETIASERTRIIHIPEYITEQGEYITCEDAIEEQFDDNQTEYVYEEVEATSPPTTTTYAVEAKQESPQEEVEVEQGAVASAVIHEELDLNLSQGDEKIASMQLVDSAGGGDVVNPCSSNSGVSDPDERFLLSCAPVLKRLSMRKNALVKLKIQQLLYEVEFGDVDCGSEIRRRNVT
ncbi:transcription factor Adf-1-like [Topomyia yanbarensis]|uniref:transcription factor Adf-1-like n=1 Tax=Topomyia yanbarensis TaxID=2498891 RepID=UPI00273C0D70|nr:transcription factor Adf-1-like [Topomyia yanbarensis]